MNSIIFATNQALIAAKKRQQEHPFSADLDLIAWREFRRSGGMQLDPDLWNLDSGIEEVLSGLVEKCISEGFSSDKVIWSWLYETDASVRYLKKDVNARVKGPNRRVWDSFGELISCLVKNWISRMSYIRDVATGMREPSELSSFPKLVPGLY